MERGARDPICPRLRELEGAAGRRVYAGRIRRRLSPIPRRNRLPDSGLVAELSKRSRNRKTAGPTPCRFAIRKLDYLPRLTAFFSSAPAVNFATRRAAILMVAPV